MVKISAKYLIFLCFVMLIISGCGKKTPDIISEQKALRIAAKTPEVAALLSYQNAALVSCMNIKVMRSCDSQWVTCRDNAWVVQYALSVQCPVVSDGRLGMNFVIDGLTGKIISRYPEKDYFQNPIFCRDQGDCVGGIKNNKQECLNFIAAPFAHFQASASCLCQKGQCILKE